MNVAQLIQILSKLPKDQEVLVELTHDLKLPIKEVYSYKEEKNNKQKIIIRGPA